MSTLIERWPGAVMNTYGTPPLALVRGEGAVVVDEAGQSYVDFLAGLAVNALGHAHPAVVAAVTAQVATLGHVSNLYASPPAVALAERLLGLARRQGAVFFANSGAEANEAAFKLSRRTGRTHVVAASGGFHGRTMGALALTGQPTKADPFRPLPGSVTHVPYGDPAALARAVSRETAMVILEPIQGEAGVVVPPPGYLAAARAVADEHGALLALDEVQTGIGRTGHWFAHQAEGIEPDVVTLAKGLGGGLPLSACVAFGDAATLLGPGSHGSTFGGNPVCCAAALAVLDTIEAEGLLDHAKRVGELLRAGIEGLGHPFVAGVRGAGLLLGIVLRGPGAAAVTGLMQQAGFLTNAVAPDVVRLAPPLIVTAEQVEAFLAALPAALDAATEPGRPGGGPRPRGDHEGRPVPVPAARRPAVGGGHLREAVAAHPGLLRRGHRRARRSPRRDRQPGHALRAGRDDRRCGARTFALRQRHRHPVQRRRPAGRARRRVADTGGQRADRRLPPLPGARRPAHYHRAAGRVRPADPGLSR